MAIIDFPSDGGAKPADKVKATGELIEVPAGIGLLPDPSSKGAIFLSHEFAQLTQQAPETVLQTPSMMSPAERRALYHLAARHYQGEGLIIDAGIFLGASTRCFAAGVADNPRAAEIKSRWTKPIVSFERGIVSPTMPKFFQKAGLEISAAPGELFVDEIQKIISPVKDMVDLRIGDIMETSANIESDVELLFLDVLKLPQISKYVLSKFFPLLIPNRSIVVQQDYFHDKLPYICVDQEFFGKYFEYHGEIGSTALFRCVKKIPLGAISEFNEQIEPREQSRLSSIAMHRSVDPARRFLVALSRVRLIFRTLGLEAASAYLGYLKLDYPEQVRAMPKVVEETENFLSQREEAQRRNRAKQEEQAQARRANRDSGQKKQA